MTRVDSPFPIEKEEVRPIWKSLVKIKFPFILQEAVVEKTVTATKYALKPAKDLRSKFLLEMEQREIDRIMQEKERFAEAERKRLKVLTFTRYIFMKTLLSINLILQVYFVGIRNAAFRRTLWATAARMGFAAGRDDGCRNFCVHRTQHGSNSSFK